MTTADTLRCIVEALDRAGIGHMLAGSFASSLHGLARTTADEITGDGKWFSIATYDALPPDDRRSDA